jgi:predicted alpha/beta-hydrolase family hydrolase
MSLVETIVVDATHSVSGLFCRPPSAHSCLVLAHGAGAGMTHPFLEAFSVAACERGIATLRFQFPYMQEGKKRPDAPALAHATIRAAVKEVTRLAPDLPLFAGGKSFGGRMTSQAAAISPLPGVRGLAFLGFPLHPANRPSSERGKHLSEVEIPMLFLQGSRDALCELEHLRATLRDLGSLAILHVFEGADHSFHVPARSGETDAGVWRKMIDALNGWIQAILLRE